MFVLLGVGSVLLGLVLWVDLGLRCGLVGACCGVEWCVVGVLSQIVLSQEAFLSQSVFLSQGTFLSQAVSVTNNVPVTRGLPVTSGFPITEGFPVTSKVPVSATMIPVTSGCPVTNGSCRKRLSWHTEHLRRARHGEK